MQAVRPGRLHSEINVTPLVDVVLVLLIVFMIVAPRMADNPAVNLPATAEPHERTDAERQIVVGLEHDGTVRIDGESVEGRRFQRRVERLAKGRADWQVLIKGDARLTFGEVKQAMLAVEAAGFSRIALITRRLDGVEP